MLKVAGKLSEINFSNLMSVYYEANLVNGKEFYPDDTEAVQIRKAEEDFYQYLSSIFFHQKASYYMIWMDMFS